MSEQFLIAILGFLGAIFGSIIGAAGSRAFGPSPRESDEGSGCARTIFIAAITGAALALGFVVAGFFLLQGLEDNRAPQSEVPRVNPEVTNPTDTPTNLPTATLQPQTEPTTVRFSCRWEDDWEMQPDGTYLWIGTQPGTPGCPKIGQEGELLTRMSNGERLTLVVDVGDTALPIAICLFSNVEISGTFIESTGYLGPCYDDKVTTEDNYPKVGGLVRITGSTGFAIGYTP